MNDRSLADDQGKATGLVEAGRQLAEARAAAGLSQNQLAGQLHMGEEQLAALERGDQTELPEPVFIKACLLYTSPSPRDLSTSRMPSSA